MSQILYGYSLYTALTLMLFFGFYFIAARKPDNPVFSNYIRSRRIFFIPYFQLLIQIINSWQAVLEKGKFLESNKGIGTVKLLMLEKGPP